MTSRRGRPTLRVLQDDLRDGWESPHARPQAGAKGLGPLSSLSELRHPIIRKAVRSMCGTFFVPYQDHESLPRCEVCEERYLALPE